MPAAFADLVIQARKVDWAVYAKPPFGGPQQVLEYLGRYTHRVALSNNRLLRIETERVLPVERLSMPLETEDDESTRR